MRLFWAKRRPWLQWNLGLLINDDPYLSVRKLCTRLRARFGPQVWSSVKWRPKCVCGCAASNLYIAVWTVDKTARNHKRPSENF
ncbi:hypothetical protein BD311DRAFT_752567, partial [Dichomitus squalens]